MTGVCVLDEESVLTPTLARLHRPDRGIWAVHGRPSMRHLGWLYTDLLSACGRAGLRGSGGSSWASSGPGVLAWLHVDGITEVVVGGCQDFEQKNLASLVQFAILGEVRLWLVFDAFVSPAGHRIADDFLLTWMTPSAFTACEALHPTPPSPASPLAMDVRGFPTVPHVAAPTFLAECRRTMSESDLEQVATTVRDAARAGARLFRRSEHPDEEEVATALHRLIASTRSVDEAVSAVRGFQVAALRNGALLQVDPMRLLNRSPGGIESRAWSEREWEQLDVLARPRDAACAVLSFLGLAPDEIAALPASAVGGNGSVVQAVAGPLEVPVPARRFLAAQHIYRLGSAAPGEELYLAGTQRDATVTPDRVARLLGSIAVMTGLPLRTRWTREPKEVSSWRHRLGLVVRWFA